MGCWNCIAIQLVYCDLVLWAMGCIAEKKTNGNCIAIYKSVLQGKEAGKLHCNIVVR